MGATRLEGTGGRPGRRRAAGVVGLVAAAGAAGWYVYVLVRAEVEALAARRAVAARRLDDAERAIGRWVALRPRAGEPYYLLARVAVARDDPRAALEAIGQAADRGYPAPPLDVLRAVLQARAGRHREAEPVLRRAFDAARGPEPEIDEALARIYLAGYRLGLAGEAIDRWRRDAPDDPRPYLWRNQIEERTGSPAEVRIANYREALRRDPGLDQARLGLAGALRELGRTGEAEAEFSAYLARHPEDVEAHLGAGRNALLKGDVPAATRHFEDALRLNPREPFALRELALIDVRAGRHARACDRLKAAVAADPYTPEVRYSYARALKLAGDEEGARREQAAADRLKQEHQDMSDLREALVRTPNDPTLRSRAAKWLLDHGHEQEALEWTRLILRDHPGHRPTCRLLADYHARKGELGLANYYRLAASPGPDEDPPR